MISTFRSSAVNRLGLISRQISSSAPSSSSSSSSTVLAQVVAASRRSASTISANNTAPTMSAAPSGTIPPPQQQQQAAECLPDDLPRAPLSDVPQFKDGVFVKTAGCLIIGDEVLNGKTKDSNSNFAAKLFFDLAIDLKRIEVIADEEDQIVEAVTRMAKNYDLVITSGGIGPTHDDITYQSIAKAFNVDLEYHDETISRMRNMSVRRNAYQWEKQSEEQKKARLRMALFPVGSEVLFVNERLWVPVVRVAGKVCILPGVPTLFQQLLEGLVSRFVPLPPSSEKPFRLLVHTEMPESSIAPFLTRLQERVKKEGISVGSYPKIFQGVDVSLIGKDVDRIKEIAQEVVAELKGEIVSEGKLGEETQVKKAH